MGYNRNVRRLLAITLMVLFGLPAVAPLFALEGTAELSLPICCRKNGAHHCTQRAFSPTVSDGTAIRSSRQPCHAYPATVTPIRQNQVFLEAVFQLSTKAAIHAASEFHSTSLPRFFFNRSEQQRGPPSVTA